MPELRQKLEDAVGIGGMPRDIVFLCISAAALICSIFNLIPGLPFDIAWVAIILCGLPIVLEAIIGLVTEFDIRADVLVSLALIASILIGEYFAAGEIVVIMQLGGLLEEVTVARARSGIEKLIDLSPQTARVIDGNEERIIPAEEVRIDDVLRVLPGETIAVDGVITSGETSIDEAVMTGESMPVDKREGDEVSSGTVNQFGAFEMRATRVGEDSSIQRMISLVQSADAGKAQIVHLADRWATWIVVIALVAAALTWLISGQIIRAVTILVVFCPCALVLATPTAIVAAIANASRHGFLVRIGDALERLATVDRIAFDKTGTLTHGIPEVLAVTSVCDEYTDEDIYGLAASVERLSEHPLAKAVVRCFQSSSDTAIVPAEDFKQVPGQGVCAAVGDTQILAGNAKMMQANGIVVDDETCRATDAELEAGHSIIFIAREGKLLGWMTLADTSREESGDMVRRLKDSGVTPVLLTGDHANTARAIAEPLGIDEVHPNCLPEDKLTFIEQWQDQGEKVCMMGDGINDAPALKKADVGIAMGDIGSDIAVDAADIVLVEDEVEELPHLVALSKRMMTTIRLNLTFSLTLNLVAIVLAITGILGPVIGALVHNAGSVLVIINSALLVGWTPRTHPRKD